MRQTRAEARRRPLLLEEEINWSIARPARERISPSGDRRVRATDHVARAGDRPIRPVRATGEPIAGSRPGGGERRTVVIRGQVADRGRPVQARRRPPRSVQERALAKPDRIAMWAVLLGLLLVIVAATSAHP